jgi:hypothetical protein
MAISAISALRRLRKDQELKASLGYIVHYVSKTKHTIDC